MAKRKSTNKKTNSTKTTPMAIAQPQATTPPQASAPPKPKRTRWIMFLLYPDNRYHMAYLDYLKLHNVGFYIEHVDNDEHGTITYEGVHNNETETKRHIHCAVYFENARTVNGFLDSLPTVDYLVTKKELIIDEEGNEKERVTLSSNLSAFTPYKGEIRTQKLLTDAKAVNDIYAQAHYFIHDTFECFMLGKKAYSPSDVKMLHNDREIYDKLLEDNVSDTEIVETLLSFAKSVQGNKNEFLSLVLSSNSPKLLKYVQSHTYFVDKFLF